MNKKPREFSNEDRVNSYLTRNKTNLQKAKENGWKAKQRRLEKGFGTMDVAKLLGITGQSVINKEEHRQQFTVLEAIRLIEPYRIRTLKEFKEIFDTRG